MVDRTMDKPNVSASVSPFWAHNPLTSFWSLQFDSAYGSQNHSFSFFFGLVFEDWNLSSWLASNTDHSFVRDSDADVSNDLRRRASLVKNGCWVRRSIFVYVPNSGFMSSRRHSDYVLFSLVAANSWNYVFMSSFDGPRYTTESRLFVRRWKGSHLNCVKRVVGLNHSNRISSWWGESK